MKLLLFGGTFDPPHRGHLYFLRSAAAAVKPDLVLIMPAGVPPHKRASATPAPVRAAMCRALAREAGLPMPCKVSSYEIRRPGKSYTAHTVDALKKQYPGARLFLAAGSDMIETFTGWHDYRRLLAGTTLVTQSRQAGDTAFERAAANLAAQGAQILVTGAPPLELSSTQIRQQLGRGGRGLWQLPAGVGRIVRKRHLYRTPQKLQSKELAP